MRDLTRRRFMKQAGLAAGGLAFGESTLLAQNKTQKSRPVSANERIQVGVIGAGRQGRNNALVFAQSPAGAEVVAVCDVDRERREAVAEETDIETVFVDVPTGY